MKIEDLKVVTIDFKVYDNETKELLEDTKTVGPFQFVYGTHSFVPKVEEALKGKEKGYKTEIIISPEEGYGEFDEDLIEEMPREEFSEFDDIFEGMEFEIELEDGTYVIYTITEIDDDTVHVDGNHPFSGKDLKFEIEVVNVRDATDDELDHGHVHHEGCDC